MDAVASCEARASYSATGGKNNVKKCIRRFAGVAFGGLFAIGIASANITPTFVTDTAAGGGLFTYSYTLALDAAQTMVTGSEFCFAGVKGLAGTPTAPTSWT